ncbi:glutamyl-tRNA reductase [Edaphobacillus lindanitolerans]|uniref:Glutamyl-tRNA reductase n=1 Tax=Edaphobacillus lindanitolerans TaxID=550447 RepID=A0A1U7PPU0_9BACI|nr:glutamyl-tRNA reductase [Edaphobacillus lindanitolerans]SIT83435.1 glutamyl-tRNA reductase [Edaphobacillus lindanitolerans]
MHTIVVGVNYRTAPVELREKLSFLESELPAAMQALQQEKSILENIIVSTCNRTELYVVGDQLHTARYYVKRFLARWFDIPLEELEPYLIIEEQDQAAEHLFRVASGIDSMVLGETQILGQVRTSFLLAQENSTSGTIFNELFKRAITTAKKAHAETEIGSNAVSVSYAAVELGKKIFGTLDKKHVVILGAGKMGELAIKNLHGSGAGKVTVLNRTFSKAEAMAAEFDGTAKPMSELQCTLLEADILISSTGAKDYVIDLELMQYVEKLRKGKPLFMVDIAVPRDLDPRIGDLPNVFLYDIDDLQGIVEANLAERRRAADEIMGMIASELDAYNDWVATLGVVPVISALRKKALAIQAETMDSILNKIPDLDEREKKVLSKHTKSIINQMLKEPILQAKEIAGSPDAARQLELFQKIFGIEEKVAEEIAISAAQEREKRAAASTAAKLEPTAAH